MARKTLKEVAKAKGMTMSEMAAMGGKASKGKPRKFRMTKRRNCNGGCPMYESCPVKYLSAKKYEDKCALARMPEKARHLIEQAVLGDEAGFEDVLKELITMLVLSTESMKDVSPDERRKTIKTAMEYYKTVYGAKSRQDVRLEGSDVLGLGRLAEIIREERAAGDGKDEKD